MAAGVPDGADQAGSSRLARPGDACSRFLGIDQANYNPESLRERWRAEVEARYEDERGELCDQRSVLE